MSAISISTVKKVTKHLSVSSGLDNSAHPQLRVSKLSVFEHQLVLIIEEIFEANRIKYSGGEILTADGLDALFHDQICCWQVQRLSQVVKYGSDSLS